MKIKFFVLFILFILPLIYVSPVQCGGNQTLSVIVTSDKNVYKKGEPINITVKFKNNGNEDVLLVAHLDGSEQNFRYPRCFFTVKNSKGKIIENSLKNCKTTDPITSGAFYLIRKGDTFNMYNPYRIDMFKSSITNKPDEYTITFTYSTAASREWQWYGPYSDEYWASRNTNEFWSKREGEVLKVRDLLKKVPVLTAISNTVKIKVIK